MNLVCWDKVFKMAYRMVSSDEPKRPPACHASSRRQLNQYRIFSQSVFKMCLTIGSVHSYISQYNIVQYFLKGNPGYKN
jgi:hypothetical protein